MYLLCTVVVSVRKSIGCSFTETSSTGFLEVLSLPRGRCPVELLRRCITVLLIGRQDHRLCLDSTRDKTSMLIAVSRDINRHNSQHDFIRFTTLRPATITPVQVLASSTASSRTRHWQLHGATAGRQSVAQATVGGWNGKRRQRAADATSGHGGSDAW